MEVVLVVNYTPKGDLDNGTSNLQCFELLTCSQRSLKSHPATGWTRRKGLGCATCICYGVIPSHPRPQGSSSLPPCRGPQRSPSELPFCCILCPFSRRPLENANQWVDFVPKTSITGARRMAPPKRGALLAESWTKPEYTVIFEQPCDDPYGASESHRDFVKASHHLVLQHNSPGWCSIEVPCLYPSSSPS